MICPSCGTAIADRALICFRCGAATRERRRPPGPVPGGSARHTWIVAVALVLLVAFALLLGRATGESLPPWFGWTMASAVVALIAWRVLRRR